MGGSSALIDDLMLRNCLIFTLGILRRRYVRQYLYICTNGTIMIVTLGLDMKCIYEIMFCPCMLHYSVSVKSNDWNSLPWWRPDVFLYQNKMIPTFKLISNNTNIALLRTVSNIHFHPKAWSTLVCSLSYYHILFWTKPYVYLFCSFPKY